MKKRTIAIVAGGDSSELPVSLRSAQGIYSFIDKDKYNLYIVEMQGKRWEVVLPSGEKTPIDRNDFSFMVNGEKIAALMKKKNITCTRMAEIAGVSVAMITFITQGKREPNVKTLALIASALDCKVDDLLN